MNGLQTQFALGSTGVGMMMRDDGYFAFGYNADKSNICQLNHLEVVSNSQGIHLFDDSVLNTEGNGQQESYALNQLYARFEGRPLLVKWLQSFNISVG